MVIGFDAKRVFHNSSGLGNYSRDIVRILSDQYPENKYILYNPKRSVIDRLEKKENIVIEYPQKWIWKKLSGAWRQGPIVRQIKSDGVEIYHGLSGEIPRGLDKIQTKSVVTIHDLIFMRFPELFNPLDRKIYFNKFHYAAHHANLVIAISEQTKRDIIEYLKVDENRIEVHYQGCHPAFKKAYHNSEKEELRRRLHLPEKFILNVGTLERRKNSLVILQSIKDLPYHVVFVGKPTGYKTELIQFINDNGMHNRIHFFEGLSMDELAMLYQMSALFCYPSVFEGFGIPIIEALFSRTPVITSTGGCFAEAGGPDSIYRDSNDVDGWKNGIEYVMENDDKRQQMADKGLAFVQRFNDGYVGNGLMNAYQKLISS